MIDEIACRWAAAIDRGLSEAEETELETWLAQDRRHRGALLRTRAAMSLLDQRHALPDWEGLSPVRSRRRHWLTVSAGAVAAVLVAAWGTGLWLDRGEVIDTRVGEIRSLQLADGSVAVVNSGTKLRVAFTRAERHVEMTKGEAWFEVAHNKARPFVVASGPYRVQAVGTAFDVRREGEAARVVVTTGVVKIWSVDSDEPARRVAAGEWAVLQPGKTIAMRAMRPQASDQQLAWRERKIVLDNMTLGEAAAEFNRYNVTRLEVAPPLVGRRVVGWFRIDDVDGFAASSAAMVGGRVERVDRPGEGSITRILP
nr:FecR domain-containing protein [uncultured Sphingomonas sp.]